MKRIVCVLLPLLCFLTLCACGNTTEKASSDARTVGSTFSFGNNEWIVLESHDGKSLVISKSIVTERPWNGCDYWLNNDYKNSTFSEKEQNIIEGNIFLLDYDSVVKYFPSDNLRICNYNGSPARWLVSTEIQLPGGSFQNDMIRVLQDGTVYKTCPSKSEVRCVVPASANCGIRPALYIDAEAYSEL